MKPSASIFKPSLLAVSVSAILLSGNEVSGTTAVYRVVLQYAD